jgi:hypothetical protein
MTLDKAREGLTITRSSSRKRRGHFFLKDGIMKKIAAIISVALLLSAGRADAVELCAAVDGSWSLSSQEFRVQLDGLISAVEDQDIIPPNKGVTLSVVQFAWGARLEVPPTLINSDAAVDQVVLQIDGAMNDFGHRTDIVSAIELCMQQFIDPSDEWVIDISTDGMHSVSFGTDPITAREAAVLAGLDVLNAIGVGGADTDVLDDLVWPQPAADPPARGFTVYVESFDGFVDAMREKVRDEISFPVAVDIKPTSCPNPLDTGSPGVLPVAILGTADFDVLQVDPGTVALEGITPLCWNYEDVAAPFDSSQPQDSCTSCTTSGPDGFLDLTLKFDRQEVVAALGEVEDRGCYLLSATARLLEEFGGRGISGSDVVRIQMMGKK